MKKKFGQSTYFDLALLVILLISFFGIASQNAVFLSRDYVIGVVLKNAIEIGFMALPMTIIIITGGIDLSCGNIMVLSSMLGGIAAVKSGSIVGILVTLSVGALCGLLNGIVITKVRVPAMITTLATMYLYLGHIIFGEWAGFGDSDTNLLLYRSCHYFCNDFTKIYVWKKNFCYWIK